MKKVFAYLSIVVVLTLGLSNNVFAQDAAKTESETVSATESVTSTETAAAVEEATAKEIKKTLITIATITSTPFLTPLNLIFHLRKSKWVMFGIPKHINIHP